MGCDQSKIDNEKPVARCKDRRNLMKDAVVSRNAFATAHSAFSVSLKNIGAALSDYGRGEAEATLFEDDHDHHHQSLDATPPPPPPPPPPLPEFSRSLIKRSLSWPAIPVKNRKYALYMDNCTITEDDNEDNKEEEMADNININNNTDNVNVNEPEKVAVEEPEIIEQEKTGSPEFSRRSTTPTTSTTVNLMQVLIQIDYQFWKASQTAQEVSNLLEAPRMHYHSNFTDYQPTVDYSQRVMQAISSNRSLPNSEVPEEFETDAIVLDKLLIWEQKLYKQVKRGERIKLKYHRKLAMLNKLKKRGATTETMEKTKAAVSHWHTKYTVDMQCLDSMVSEVNCLRDEQLYPKLVALVDRMAKMWENMCIHHDNMHMLVSNLNSLDATLVPIETTKHHHKSTIQLYKVVLEWNSQFEKLVMYQKQYTQALNSWLKLNRPRDQNPPIQDLLPLWNDYLERLQDDLAISTISSFAAAIKSIIRIQEKERMLKKKCNKTRKEYLRKNQAYKDWYQQHRTEATRGEDLNTHDPVSEKQVVVESLKKRLEEEIAAYRRHCTQVREKSLGSLKIRLPELFHVLSVYSHACSDAYGKLRSFSQSNVGSSE